MSSHYRSALLAAVAVSLSACACYWYLSPAQQDRRSKRPIAASNQVPDPPERILRIAADPNNLPFSNERGEGFENKIAELIAEELHTTLVYVWRAQRRGFYRETLKGNECDLVLGAPAGFDKALCTIPYYSSTYTFVYRRDASFEITSLDDPKLKTLMIGVQLVGNDGANTPPMHALNARGIVQNIVGYTLYGDYTEENPPERIVRAVAKGDVDVALVWGPLAGYFGQKETAPLTIVPVSPKSDPSGLRFVFDIAMAVGKGNAQLKQEVDKIITLRRAEILGILKSYNVPLCSPSNVDNP
jgi:mxaJ protein